MGHFNGLKGFQSILSTICNPESEIEISFGINGLVSIWQKAIWAGLSATFEVGGKIDYFLMGVLHIMEFLFSRAGLQLSSFTRAKLS